MEIFFVVRRWFQKSIKSSSHGQQTIFLVITPVVPPDLDVKFRQTIKIIRQNPNFSLINWNLCFSLKHLLFKINFVSETTCFRITKNVGYKRFANCVLFISDIEPKMAWKIVKNAVSLRHPLSRHFSLHSIYCDIPLHGKYFVVFFS